MTAGAAAPRETVKCPVCGRTLVRTGMGVGSHLQKHRRAGELEVDDMARLRMRVLGREFKDYSDKTRKKN